MSKEKSAPEAAVDASSVKVEKFMYIGPTVLSPIPLVHRCVYSGQLPPTLARLDKELREGLSDCFVPLGQAAAALRELEGSKAAGPVTEKYKKAQRLIRSVK